MIHTVVCKGSDVLFNVGNTLVDGAQILSNNSITTEVQIMNKYNCYLR